MKYAALCFCFFFFFFCFYPVMKVSLFNLALSILFTLNSTGSCSKLQQHYFNPVFQLRELLSTISDGIFCTSSYSLSYFLDTLSRGRSSTAATSKMERFLIIVNFIITKCSILDIDPPLYQCISILNFSSITTIVITRFFGPMQSWNQI